MNIATAMFNTVYEAEGAIRSLRGADFTDIEIIARDQCKREVLLDDLVTRTRTSFDIDVEKIDVTYRLTQRFLTILQKEAHPEQHTNWYQQWLANGFVLVATYSETGIEQATQILQEHGGVPYGTSMDALSVFPDAGEHVETIDSTEMPVERRWRRAA